MRKTLTAAALAAVLALADLDAIDRHCTSSRDRVAG
jgi:hypothetical protein